jgi:peptidyl-tRNA hydrolase, PTH1 family
LDHSDNEIQFKLSKIKLVAGLGNIGREYIGSRHNIGFEFVETLAGSNRFNEEKKLKALLFPVEINHNKIILAKPTTMMNASGETVNLIMNYFKFSPEEILIVHDDLDLSLGNYKIQFDKGPKVHNGILSIENRLGTSKFWRLRIGIDNRTLDEKKFMSGADYVLGRLRNDEIVIIAELVHDIITSFKEGLHS